MNLFTQEPEAGTEDGFIEALGGVGSWLGQEIAGQVLDDELVVADIRVERPDDVIAVLKGVGNDGIEFVSTTLGVADQVEPVAAPALAEVWRGEQPIDHLGVGVL